MLRKDLGDQEHLIASASNRFGNDFLRGSRSIHLGRVDMGHAEIEAAAQRGDRRAPLGGFDMPGSLANRGYLALDGTERMALHGCPSRFIAEPLFSRALLRALRLARFQRRFYMASSMAASNVARS